MREGKKHPFAINVWRWGLLILLLVLWEIGARLKWIDPFFFSRSGAHQAEVLLSGVGAAEALGGSAVRHWRGCTGNDADW